MQDGRLSDYHGRYTDSTVMRMPELIKHQEGTIYLGLRLFNMPAGSQGHPIRIFNRIVKIKK